MPSRSLCCLNCLLNPFLSPCHFPLRLAAPPASSALPASPRPALLPTSSPPPCVPLSSWKGPPRSQAPGRTGLQTAGHTPWGPGWRLCLTGEGQADPARPSSVRPLLPPHPTGVPDASSSFGGPASPGSPGMFVRSPGPRNRDILSLKLSHPGPHLLGDKWEKSPKRWVEMSPGLSCPPPMSRPQFGHGTDSRGAKPQVQEAPHLQPRPPSALQRRPPRGPRHPILPSANKAFSPLVLVASELSVAPSPSPQSEAVTSQAPHARPCGSFSPHTSRRCPRPPLSPHPLQVHCPECPLARQGSSVPGPSRPRSLDSPLAPATLARTVPSPMGPSLEVTCPLCLPRHPAPLAP